MSIATLSNVKALLDITTTDEDAVLTMLLNAANDQAIKYLGYDPNLTTYIERRNGNGKSWLALAQPYQTEIVSLSVDGVAIPAQTEAPNGPGFVLNDGLLWMFGSYRFNKGAANVLITYKAGFTAMPDALIQGVCDLVALRREELKRRGISSKSLAGESVSFTLAAMPENIRAYFDPYRKVIWP